jgi:hypothetical protein
MPADPDADFFARADAHIKLANEQMRSATRGQVSASMLYAAARFNAWVSACGFTSGAEMSKRKGEAVSYFMEQYSKMLEENLNDYIANFDRYMKPGS